MGDDLVVVESEEQARTIIGERERERQRAQVEDQVNKTLYEDVCCVRDGAFFIFMGIGVKRIAK